MVRRREQLLPFLLRIAMLLLFTRDKQMSASTFVQDPHAQFGSHIVLGVGTTPGTLIAGTTFTLHSYVIVGTLHDVEASLVELYSVNPPP